MQARVYQHTERERARRINDLSLFPASKYFKTLSPQANTSHSSDILRADTESSSLVPRKMESL